MVAYPVPQEQTGMAMDEFIRLLEQDAPFELIDGERRPRMPGVAEHADIIGWLVELLLRVKNKAGIFVRSEAAYVLLYAPDWVRGSRIPDVVIYKSARMQAYRASTPDYARKPYILVPDVCVEVVSQHDDPLEVEAKVVRYLEDGVQQVWVIYPRTRTVHVHTRGSNIIRRLSENDTLDGGALVPTFSVQVSVLLSPEV
jgi:Uma2 family endonuclease